MSETPPETPMTRTAAWRSKMVDVIKQSISDDDLQEMVKSIVKRAKSGDLKAMSFVLTHLMTIEPMPTIVNNGVIQVGTNVSTPPGRPTRMGFAAPAVEAQASRVTPPRSHVPLTLSGIRVLLESTGPISPGQIAANFLCEESSVRELLLTEEGTRGFHFVRGGYVSIHRTASSGVAS